jgi:hypothetical protein
LVDFIHGAQLKLCPVSKHGRCRLAKNRCGPKSYFEICGIPHLAQESAPDMGHPGLVERKASKKNKQSGRVLSEGVFIFAS